MKLLVYLEERDGRVTGDSLALLGKACALDGEVAALLCGPEARQLVDEPGRFGAELVYLADDPCLGRGLPEPHVDVATWVLAEGGFEAILFETSSLTCDIAGGLAARLEAGVNWDLLDLEFRQGDLVGWRLALDDALLVEVGWTKAPRIAMFRHGVLEAVEGGTSAEIVEVPVPARVQSPGVTIVDHGKQEAERTSLDDADVVITGGRGLRDRASIALLEDLAEALDGAVGVTMPVADRGWYPRERVIGQTGRTVRPRLYIACGISGAMQHRVGMERSGTIVAINSDPTAPIFQFCDVGVVADLHDFVPRLAGLVRASRKPA
jgi:electron transfer flavoprotein alpha subunit